MFLSNSSSQSSSVNSSIDPLIDSGHDHQVNSDSNRDSLNRRLNMVISYGKEFLFILAFILTTFASVQNSSPKISRAVSPVPFFSKGSLIEDYYYGQLNPTQTKVPLSELSFVLYYAPWSSESQHSRKAYEQVARLFYREAYFSAINCWQPGSECRQSYTKIHTWPILMAYLRNGFGIQYQKNLWTEEALTKFINSLLHPIERLTSPDDLLAQMTSKDALVVAFLDMDNNPRQYRSFYQSAIKFLEKDSFNEIGFAVVTGESAHAFGVDYIPSIRAYLWNETLEYLNESWSSKDIGKWVSKNIHQVSFNLSPPGTKGSSLAPYFNQGPVLILFTPRNFYSELSDSYVLLQQVGMEYYNCGGDNWVQEMARDYSFERRKENRESYKTLHKECEIIFQQSYQADNLEDRCVASVSVSVSRVLNTSKNVDASEFCALPQKTGSCGCPSQFSYKKHHSKYSHKPNKKEKKTSMLDDSDSDVSPDAISKYNFHRKCEMLKLAEREHEILFIEDEDASPLQLVTGLACKVNKTFSLVSLDTTRFHVFAERLGIDVLEMENRTAAIIMDHENESTFLLDGPVNLRSLSKFLHDFHVGELKRFLRSNSVQYQHTHFFDYKEFIQYNNKDHKRMKDDIIKKKCTRAYAPTMERVVIEEINSEEFEVAVLKSNKTAVVFFFSANCAFCSLMQHSILSMSRILKKMPDIEWFRIDGDKNDLPWQFTVTEFPSLVVFPGDAKAESRKFPIELSINTSNILGFVLANLGRSHRLLGLVMACNYKRHNSTNDCITTIQEEITETISFLLREWRKHPRKRSVILRLIRQLRAIYLNLFSIKSSCDFMEIQETILSFLDRWLVVKL